ncbi:hypothetical protein ACFLW5_01875 [Chloroflexota bacterium]
MTDKRMLIVDVEVARKVDENRGDMPRSEFISFLMDSQLKEDTKKPDSYVSKNEFIQFTEGIKELLRNFFEFFLSYGLELGNQPKDDVFKELTQKLQNLENSSNDVKKS